MISYSEAIEAAPLTPGARFLFNVLRGLSAVLVVISHVDDYASVSLAPFSKFGHEAVVIFFILSGALVGRSTILSGRTASQFFIVRTARIYSIVLPGLLACFMLYWLVGVTDMPPYMAAARPEGFTFVDALGSLVFLSQSWGIFDSIPYNAPFWTMSYHVWYYMIFGIIYFWPGRGRWLVAGLAALLAGPSIIVLLPIWYAGYWLGIYGVGLRFSKPVAFAILATTALLLAAARYFEWDHQLREYLNASVPSFWRLGGSQRFLTDYAYCLTFILMFIAAISVEPLWRGLSDRFSSHFSRFAEATFTIYMFHYPMIFLLTSAGLVGWLSILQIGIILVACYRLSFVLNSSYPFYIARFTRLGQSRA